MGFQAPLAETEYYCCQCENAQCSKINPTILWIFCDLNWEREQRVMVAKVRPKGQEAVIEIDNELEMSSYHETIQTRHSLGLPASIHEAGYLSSLGAPLLPDYLGTCP